MPNVDKQSNREQILFGPFSYHLGASAFMLRCTHNRLVIPLKMQLKQVYLKKALLYSQAQNETKKIFFQKHINAIIKLVRIRLKLDIKVGYH